MSAKSSFAFVKYYLYETKFNRLKTTHRLKRNFTVTAKFS